jgi:hypothetical protein
VLTERFATRFGVFKLEDGFGVLGFERNMLVEVVPPLPAATGVLNDIPLIAGMLLV